MTRSRDTADQINRINSSAANATAITVDSSENVSLTGNLDVTGTVTAAGGKFLTTATKIETAIFRVNDQTLNTNTTIDADENANATGPLAVASGVTLTVTNGGNLSIV